MNQRNKNFFTKKNFKKNSSMTHICFKKDKNLSQSDNEFIDAESFIYEPRKILLKLSQQYSKEDDSFANESNIRKSKSRSLINKYQKKKIQKISSKKLQETSMKK